MKGGFYDQEKGKKLTLKDRDIEILKYLYQMGFITSHQAFLRFWLKDKAIKEYKKMLDKLREKRLEIKKYKKYRSRTAYKRL